MSSISASRWRAAGQYMPDPGALARAGAGVQVQQLREAEDRVQRRAQFVAHAPRETATWPGRLPRRGRAPGAAPRPAWAAVRSVWVPIMRSGRTAASRLMTMPRDRIHFHCPFLQRHAVFVHIGRGTAREVVLAVPPHHGVVGGVRPVGAEKLGQVPGRCSHTRPCTAANKPPRRWPGPRTVPAVLSSARFHNAPFSQRGLRRACARGTRSCSGPLRLTVFGRPPAARSGAPGARCQSPVATARRSRAARSPRACARSRPAADPRAPRRLLPAGPDTLVWCTHFAVPSSGTMRHRVARPARRGSRVAAASLGLDARAGLIGRREARQHASAVWHAAVRRAGAGRRRAAP